MKNTTFSDSQDFQPGTESGFSVIELAIVVMIALILASFSVLYFGKARSHYNLSRKAQNIASQIERARSLAVKHNQTLSMGFTTSNTMLTLTCADCATAKSELPALTLPADLKLSAYPSITIKGNGTISTTSGTIVISDGQGRQVTLSIANSGRTTVGEPTETARY
jgi:Tfp pilus assembly protein PilW